MRFVVAIGQRWKNSWKRVAEAALTLGLLSAVAVGGLVLFVPDVLAAWKVPGDVEQALASRGAFEGLLSFDAPAVLGARLKAQKEEAEESIRRVSNTSLLVENWKFTQSRIANPVQASLTLYLRALQTEAFLTVFNGFLDQVEIVTATSSSPLGPVVTNLLITFQRQVNSFLATYVNLLGGIQSLINSLIPPGLRPPPIPPASPCLC